MISAKMIADSLGPAGNRLSTMLVTMPRYILAELNTHRMLSKNSASSRAIPFTKMLEAVRTNPFIPMAWQKNHVGMQGTQYITDPNMITVRNGRWLFGRDSAVIAAQQLFEELEHEDGQSPTKQLVNRMLEGYMYHTVLVSATEWENFFYLRCPVYKIGNIDVKSISGAKDAKAIEEATTIHTFRSWKDVCKVFPNMADFTLLQRLKANTGGADIHMMAVAEAMWDCYNLSIPVELQPGDWHIPFNPETEEDYKTFMTDSELYNTPEDIQMAAVKIATARAARTSYTVMGEEAKTHTFKEDIKLHERLATSGHWSPFEHCARVMTQGEYYGSVINEIIPGVGVKTIYGTSGNFIGFQQYRKFFPKENVTK